VATGGKGLPSRGEAGEGGRVCDLGKGVATTDGVCDLGRGIATENGRARSRGEAGGDGRGVVEVELGDGGRDVGSGGVWRRWEVGGAEVGRQVGWRVRRLAGKTKGVCFT
jgi:hypothetical protein